MTTIKLTAGLAALLALMACEPEKKDAMMGETMSEGDAMMSDGDSMSGDTMMSDG